MQEQYIVSSAHEKKPSKISIFHWHVLVKIDSVCKWMIYIVSSWFRDINIRTHTIFLDTKNSVQPPKRHFFFIYFYLKLQCCFFFRWTFHFFMLCFMTVSLSLVSFVCAYHWQYEKKRDEFIKCILANLVSVTAVIMILLCLCASVVEFSLLDIDGFTVCWIFLLVSTVFLVSKTFLGLLLMNSFV